MNASFWMVSALLCAPAQGIVSDEAVHQNPGPVLVAVQVQPAASRIIAVTVYPGQALVTREVTVPEAEGTVEVVVTPLPSEIVVSSLDAEGSEEIHVQSTRFRARLVVDEGLVEVKALEAEVARLDAETQRIQAEIKAQEQDVQFLQKLENFTSASVVGSTEKGMLESRSVVAISHYLMTVRGDKLRSKTELSLSLKSSTEAMQKARGRIAELKTQSRQVERDAVIRVQKTKADAGTIRLTYLVQGASWWPQYRLRATEEDAPVGLEYLAAITQQTGEDWSEVRVTLSTSSPSLDAAPPELLPLTIVTSDAPGNMPFEGLDESSVAIGRELDRVIDLPFKTETTLEDVIKHIRASTRTAAFPQGIPIYVDPIGLTEAEKTTQSPIEFDVDHVSLRTALRLMLRQLDLTYEVKDGLLTITYRESDDDGVAEGGGFRGGMGGMGGGMGGLGLSMERAQATNGTMLNRSAAMDQTQELRVGEGSTGHLVAEEKETPSVTLSAPGVLNLPSRPEPQLLEVARAELPAEFYAKAIPVLTSRVYRLAKLTNAGSVVILPGEATVYVGSNFVGRMKMPLVATGEPFLAGFGVDPQVQVSRRLIAKSRIVQGGNQVLTYEFRLGVRNYRERLVKLQLWDRLPSAEGENVAVRLVTTSTDLSTDPLYQKTARNDNLLRWDLDVPEGTVGDKAMYVNYEFRLEFARELPPPKFSAGGLNEAPIGGGAMGMGGMGGGFRSVTPR